MSDFSIAPRMTRSLSAPSVLQKSQPPEESPSAAKSSVVVSRSSGRSKSIDLTSSRQLSAISKLIEHEPSSKMRVRSKSLPQLSIAPPVPKTSGHPPWIKPSKMEDFIDGVQLPDKRKTLLSLNEAKAQGKISGDTLLYFGAGADIMHPLLTTTAKEMHFVDMGMDFDSVRSKLSELFEAGFELQESDLPDGKKFTVVKTDGQEAMFTLHLHKTGYDTFIQDNGDRQFDYFMDKDSWLGKGGWKGPDDLGVSESILSLVKDNGLWVGGYEVVQESGSQFLKASVDDITSDLVSDSVTWSGYEKIQVRRKKQDVDLQALSSQVRESAQQDPTWTKIQDQVLNYIDDYSDSDTLLQLNIENISAIFDMLPVLDVPIQEKHIQSLADYVMQKNPKNGTVSRDDVVQKIREAVE